MSGLLCTSKLSIYLSIYLSICLSIYIYIYLYVIMATVVFQRLPESARYLVAAGRSDEALTVLRQAAIMNNSKLPHGRLVQSKQVGEWGDAYV